jgi:hypothetical protein
MADAGRTGLVMRRLLLSCVTVYLGLIPPCDGFLVCGGTHDFASRRSLPSKVILQAGGKFNKDPSAASRIAELINSFQQKQRQYSEHPNRYMEEGMDAIKRHEPFVALEAFDRALALDNEVRLCL